MLSFRCFSIDHLRIHQTNSRIIDTRFELSKLSNRQRIGEADLGESLRSDV